MKYQVFVNMNFGYDDTFEAEYSGMEYTTREEAENELKAAKEYVKHDKEANYAYIREFEC